MQFTFKKTIYAFALFSASLLLYRIIRSDSLSYIFLAWNLFLAFIPFWISDYLKRQEKQGFKYLPLLGIWLLFLPNSPYILTDLFHFRARPFIPLWFDLILVASFVIIGFAVFYRSVMDMREVFKKYIPAAYMRYVMPLVFWLVAFGLYLGRYLRFNSWDIIHPIRLAKASALTLLSPDALCFTCIFSVFMWLVYITLIHYNRHEEA
ncbi:MAG: DUF1361 domain-containing protein [Bacteroidetes bacterium]|nr:DUF1361 domain-containing protein [Bacteroidota bacterium]